MRLQRNLAYLFFALSVVTLILYVSPLPPIPPLNSCQANDILMAIFGGSATGEIVALLECHERRREADQQFFPCATSLFEKIAALRCVERTDETKEAVIAYLEEAESNEFRRNNPSIFGSSQEHDAASKLTALICPQSNAVDEDACKRFTKNVLDELKHAASSYISLLDGGGARRVQAASGLYAFVLGFLSIRARDTNSVTESMVSLCRKVEAHEREVGELRLFAKDSEEASPANALRAEAALSRLWHRPSLFDDPSSVNSVASGCFPTLRRLVRSSAWPERTSFPEKPYWW